MGKHAPDERSADTDVEGLTNKYIQMRYSAKRAPGLSLKEME